MAAPFYRRIAVSRSSIHIDTHFWSLNVPVDRPECIALSALGTLIHNTPGILKKVPLLDLFHIFKMAYKTPNKLHGHLLFDADILAANNLREAHYLSADADQLSVYTKEVFGWLKNRLSPPQKAVMFLIFPTQKSSGDNPCHAMTILCDGIWAHIFNQSGGFGYQETRYLENGFPSHPERWGKRFDTREGLVSSLNEIIATSEALFSYKAATIRMVAIEPLQKLPPGVPWFVPNRAIVHRLRHWSI